MEKQKQIQKENLKGTLAIMQHGSRLLWILDLFLINQVWLQYKKI